MCGRARCTLDPDAVARTTHVPRERWVRFDEYQPSYNLAPGAATPVVVAGADGERSVHVMRWGLVPSFTKPDEKPDFFRMFNARSETVTQKAAFRRLVPRRRCVVLMNGFFEWRDEHGRKQPYYVHLRPLGGGGAGAAAETAKAGNEKGEQQQQQQQQQQQEEEKEGKQQQGQEGQQQQGQQPPPGPPPVMKFAGLWDVWAPPQGGGGQPLHTYTVLTTPASKKLRWLHDRMPALLPTREAEDAWLSVGELSQSDVERIAAPYDGPDLAWHPVTPKMNAAGYQGEDACDEVKPPKSITSFFRPVAATAAAAAAPAGPKDQAAAMPSSSRAAAAPAGVKAEEGSGSGGGDGGGAAARDEAWPRALAAAPAAAAPAAGARGAGQEVERERERGAASMAAAQAATDSFAGGGPSTSSQQQRWQTGSSGAGGGGGHKGQGMKRGAASPAPTKSPKKAKGPAASGKGQTRLDAFFSNKKT